MRNRKTLADVLISYADQLAQGQCSPAGFLKAFPEYGEELSSLMNIAARVKEALVPKRPSPAYRRALHRNLVETARQKMMPHIMIHNPSARRRIVIISAAIGSAISVIVGVIAALLIRSRTLQGSHEVPTA